MGGLYDDSQRRGTYMGVNVRTVYRKAKDGTIPCYRIGRAMRFKKEEIETATKKQVRGAEASPQCHVIRYEGVLQERSN